MAATFSPEFVIDVTDQVPNGQTATVTLPTGSWNLSSVTTTGDNVGTTIEIGSSLTPAATVGNGTVTLPATNPAAVITGTLTFQCGGAGNLNDTVLRLTSAQGQSLTIVVA